MTAGKKAWLTYALAWLPAAVLYGMAVAAQPEVLFIHGLISGIVVMGAAALLGVGVVHVTRRIPLPGVRGRIAFALIHLVLAIAYSGLWLAAMLGWLAIVAPPGTASIVLRQAGTWQFLTGTYMYALIAGVSYLLLAQRTLRERSVAVARAQLQAVRARLQPHFLFNVLHGVGTLVRADPAAAERALEQVGDLLRRALDHGGAELVPFGDEWSFAREYLDLEHLRLGRRLRIDAHIDDGALDVSVPAFLLQPLVENAVRHGIAPRAEGGTITIDARRANGALTLYVADDGAGAESDRIGRVGGLGLDGVRRQLEGLYGARATMLIDTAPGSGFRVTVTLPADA
ncbi:MAG TPA: histidine kinase [Longimicrobiales bacterium]|nr:histidine kinase [Longimicrobiales bacterium]